MTSIVQELYTALKAAGVDEGLAVRAAGAVLGRERETPGHELVTVDHLRAELAPVRAAIGVTAAELRAELAQVKVEIIRWNVGTLIALAGLGIAAMKLL